MQILHDSIGNLRRLSWEQLESKSSGNLIQMSKTGNPIKHSKPNANGKLRKLKERILMVSWQRMLKLIVCITCLLANYVTQTYHNQEASYRVGAIPDHHYEQGALRSGRAVAGTQ